MFKTTANKKAPLALIGEKADENIKNALKSHGFNIISLPSDERLAAPVAHHADMLIFVLENVVFCNEKYFKENQSVFNLVSSYGYSVCPSSFEVSKAYPKDVALNQAVIGNAIVGKRESCAKSVLEHAELYGYSYVSVKQGYAKCSTLILGDEAVISADDGIITAARELGSDALKITNRVDEINLDGYDYGFIGGASAVYGDKVFFFGNLELHGQSAPIRKFCEKHGFRAVSLSDFPLCDLGGAVILPDISN